LNTPVVEGVFEGSRALFDLAEIVGFRSRVHVCPKPSARTRELLIW
jgi:hypothetical protein